jgi:hypothetical protein
LQSLPAPMSPSWDIPCVSGGQFIQHAFTPMHTRMCTRIRLNYVLGCD